MKSNLKRKLKAHYQNVPPMPNPHGMKQVIIQVRSRTHPASKEKGLPFGRFLISQLGFIRKKVWLTQLLILFACGFALYCLPEEAKILAVISAAAPLIVLTNIVELSRSYAHGMVEIELCTRYSFKQLMIARLCVLGMMDVLCLSLLLVLSGVQLSVEAYALILYALIPFLATCFACLLVLNRVKRKVCNDYCVVIGAFISLGIGITTVQYPQMYALTAVWAWGVALVLALAGVVVEIGRMLKDCEQKLDPIQLKNQQEVA